MNGYSVHRLNSAEFAEIDATLSPGENTLVARIDGRDIKKWWDYAERIATAFQFPYGAEDYDGYNECMLDLGWLTERGITNFVIVITDFSGGFLRKDPKSKWILYDLFILSEKEWDADSTHKNTPRTFSVYLVD